MRSLKHDLAGQSKEQLLILAEELGILNYKSKSKNQLQEELLKSKYKRRLKKFLGYSWLNININRIGLSISIVGILPILGLFEPIDKSYVKLDVSLMNYQEAREYFEKQDEWDFGYDSYDSTWYGFAYLDSISNDLVTIYPRNNYLSSYFNDNKIKIEDVPNWEWLIETHNPMIDLKFINNTKETIIVNKIIVEVEESEKDTRPFIMLYEESGMTSGLALVNQSWEKWEYCDFRFSFGKNELDFNGTYKYHKRINEFEKLTYFSLVPYLEKSGVNYKKLIELPFVSATSIAEVGYEDFFKKEYNMDELNCIYGVANTEEEFNQLKEFIPFVDGEFREKKIFTDFDEEKGDSVIHELFVVGTAYLHGELIFPNYPHPITVKGEVAITQAGGGAALWPNHQFDVELKTEGRNYTIELPKTLYMKPGDPERIALRISAPQSSIHKLKFRFSNINDMEIVSNPIKLDYFRLKHLYYESED